MISDASIVNNLQCSHNMADLTCVHLLQGIANGVLLITPHSVMFKPNVSDPLVMDRGQDTYSIATLMTSVTSAAMYTDIAAMAIHDPLKPGR